MDSVKLLLVTLAALGFHLYADANQRPFGGVEEPAEQIEAREIAGLWKFADVIIENKRQARPNPNLHMYYTLDTDGASQLEWRRTGEHSFCQRRGTWSLEEGKLVDNVTWLNPDNASACAQDPDMRLGLTTKTPVSLVDGEIHMVLTVGEQQIIYIWQRSSRPEFP